MVYDSVFNVLVCHQPQADDLRTLQCASLLCCCLFLNDSLYILSYSKVFVNNFFYLFQHFFAERREWDSNPCALADKRFSRPPRYDHFDISPYCRRPESNRYGRLVPQDFKSCASACSATPADGTYRARTYDPLLVRQMLSLLS